MLYIDPPYNIGNKDFIYDDKIIDKTDTFKHSKWSSFIKRRLEIARYLLQNSGCIFISINDNEQPQLRLLCDDIFGYDNFCGQIIWNKKSGGGQTDEFFVTEHEYILVYRKSSSFKWLDEEIKAPMEGFKGEDERGKFKTVKLAKWGTASRREDRPTMYFSIKNPDGKNTFPIAPDGSEGRWRIGKKRMELTKIHDNIYWEKINNIWVAYEKIYYDVDAVKVLKTRSIFLDMGETGDGSKTLTDIFGKKDVFQNPKPIELIMELLSHAKNKVVLDFFAGSGTTGHAVLELAKEDNDKHHFILCTNNENNICREITYKRIKKIIEKKKYSASLKYYKIDYIPISDKIYYEYADELLEHIRELVELENAINFTGNDKIAIVLTDEELAEFVSNIKKHKNCRKLYKAHNILVSGKQREALKNAKIRINVIPDYYYGELET